MKAIGGISGARFRADPVDDKPVSDSTSRRKKQMVQKGVRDGNGFDEVGNCYEWEKQHNRCKKNLTSKILYHQYNLHS